MRVQRVQLLSAILLAVAIIETSTTEQINEILNDEVDGDASRGFIFDKDFDKYLQAEDGEDNGDGGNGGNNGDGGDGGNNEDGGAVKPPNSKENDSANATTDASTITEATDPIADDTTTTTDTSTTTEATDTTTTTDTSTTTEATDPTADDTTTTTDASTTTEATDPTADDTTTTTDASTTTEATDPTADDTTTTTDASTTTEATDPTADDTTTTTDASTTTEATDPTADDTTTTTDASTTTEATDPTADDTTTTTDASTTTETPPIGSEEYPIKVSTCIFANMTITLEVTYEMKNDTTATGTLSVPSSPEVDGACNGTEAFMILQWKPTVSGRNIRDLDNVYAADPEKNKLTLHFKRSNTEFWLDKMDIDIILDEKNFPNAKNSTLSTTTDANLNLFSAPVSNSKSVCNTEITVNTNDENVKMQIKDVDLIAFNEESDITSRSESNCVKEEDIVETSDVGAIVGGIIGALAIVGIIGFIIWRRRRNSYARSEVA